MKTSIEIQNIVMKRKAKILAAVIIVSMGLCLLEILTEIV